MKKSLTTIAILGLSTVSFAQETAATTGAPVNQIETTSPSLYDTLKSGPVRANAYIDASTGSNSERSTRIKAIYEAVGTSLGWKITDKDQIGLATKFSGTSHVRFRAPDKKSDFRFERAVLSYRRKAILQQANHGIELGLGVESRYWGDNVRLSQQAYGHNRLTAQIDRKFSDAFAVNMTAYATMYMGRSNDEGFKGSSVKSYYGTYIAQSYSFNDIYTMSLAQEYYYMNRRDDEAKQSLTLYFNHNFTVNSVFNFDLYAQTSEMFQNSMSGTKVKSSLGNDWEKNLAAGVTLNFNIF